MTLRQRLINSPIAHSLGRRLSGPPESDWDDTVAGPLDPLRESDLRGSAKPGPEPHGNFASTMPMGLPKSERSK